MVSMVYVALLLVILSAIFNHAHSFIGTRSTRTLRPSMLSMMFGMGKKPVPSKKAVQVTVDGKVLTSTEPSINLRKFLIANGVDVYPLKAKITGNCGGAGICGTCAVKVISGAEYISETSKNELNTLKEKGKPSDQRLSCCARVSGPITIKTKP